MTTETITLPRSGHAPLRFTGELIAETDGRAVAGRDHNRWHTLAVYRTSAGRYVVAIGYRTRWEGELDRDLALVCGSPADVAETLLAFDPCDGVQGYPAGEAYAAKQARLILDLRQRFEALVSEVLDSDEFAEEIT